MKTLALFIAITFTMLKVGLKVSPLLIVSKGSAQQYMFGTNVSDTSAGFYETNSPTSIHPNRRYMMLFNKRQMNIRAKRMMWDSLKAGNTSISSNAKFTYIDAVTGEQMVCKMDSLNKWIAGNVTIPLSHVSGTSAVSASITAAGSATVTRSGQSFTVNTPVFSQSVQPVSLSLSGQSLSAGTNTIVISTQTTGIVSNITPTVTGLTGMSVTTSGESYSLTNTLPDRTVTIAGTGINVTSSYPGFTLALPTRTVASVTRSLNVAFQVSVSSDYNVNYSINLSVTSILLGTNAGTVSLQISPTSGGTYTIISQSSMSAGGVAATFANTQTIGGFIPAGYYVKMVTAQVGANGATFTYQSGQENSY